MELDTKKIGIYVRKGLIYSIRVCYKSAHDHPFVLGMVIFSFLLYRFLPSVFAFLVSSSPVLFCTAVLLGTLLSFGNPDIPEVEEDEKKTHEISSLKTGGVSGDLIVEKDESFAAEARVERREIDEKVIEKASSGFSGEGLSGEAVVLNKVEKDAISSMALDEALVGQSLLIEEVEKEHHREKEEIGEKVYSDHGFVDKEESDENLIKCVAEADENVEGHHHIDEQEKENENPADEILNLLTEKRVDSSLGHSESDSDSDGAESSSPDASMADIMPMLDELHPLLDSDAPQHPHIPIDDSDTSSQGSSHESDEGSAESVDDAENQEEAHEDQEDKTEAVVKWTEDDEKNLMDLGSSELERNRRLENLIAKRMARKHQRIAIEKNLIDLDNSDVQTTLPMSGGLDHIQFQVPPISTVRRNPFDFPFNSNEIGGLPPIPGSAPSVLLPRRNPFDLPFERVHDRGSLTGETSGYQEEFMSAQERDMHFRRHDSFNSGVPISFESRQDKHDSKLKPYFVPEGVTSGEAIHATFQRQLSEMSDSKMSSIPDTDTVSSIGDQEQEHVLLQDLHQEGAVISPHEGSAEPVELRSESEVDHVDIGRKGRDIDVGDAHEVDLRASEIIEEACHGTGDERETSSPVSVVDEEFIPSTGRPDVREVYEKSELVEENYKGLSSSSSEANEKIFEMNPDKELGIVEATSRDSFDINLDHVEGVDSGRVETPVYDLSPSDIEKSLSNMSNVLEDLFYMDKRVFNSTSSISSDTHKEVLDGSVHPVAVERSFAPRTEDASSDNLNVEKEVASGYKVSWVASSSLDAIEEKGLLQSREVMGISVHDVVQAGHSEVHHCEDAVEPMIPELMIEQVSQGSWETKLIEGGLMEEKGNQQFQEAQIPLSTFDEEIHVGGLQLDVEGKIDAATVTYSDWVVLSDASQQTHLLIDESAAQLPSKGSYEDTEVSMLYTPCDHIEK